MAEILAIIPFYKQEQQLARCLSALSGSLHPIEPFVVDNNRENIGFTKACNVGLRESIRRGHRYALLLNQDCYVSRGAVGHLVAFMEQHPRCAIAGPKQINFEEPDHILHGGCTEAYPVGVHLSGLVSENACCVSLPMPWVNGACMILRTDALLHTGLMDEGYFLIASDADLCFTARQRQWEVWYCAEAEVSHETGGVSSQQKSIEALAHFQRDQLRFRDKWIGSLSWECLKNPPPAPGVKLSEGEVRDALKSAISLFQSKQLREAETVVRRLLEYDPDHAVATVILSRIYIQLEAPAVAVKLLMAISADVSGFIEAQWALGDALFLCHQGEASIAHYLKARALGADTAELCNQLGAALFEQGWLEQAVAEWQRALRLDPNNAFAMQRIRLAEGAPGRQAQRESFPPAETVRISPPDDGMQNAL
jgi:hypothetical protein